jgi:hypothetical protein
MEDNLKNFQMDFLSNHWVDLNQILNLTPGDQTKTDEDKRNRTLKNFKMDFLSNHLADLNQLLT